jgi:hypothetical protein
VSKVFRTIATVATVVAAAATIAVTAGASLPLIAGASIATVAGAVAAVAGTLAAATAKKPPAVGTSNQFTIDPQAGIPYCIGRTFAGGRIVHVDGWGGPENPYRSYVIAFSGGGPSDSIESVLIDRSPVSVGSGGALGYYSGFMWLSTQLGASPSSSALLAPFAGFPGWGASHKLSGYAAGLWTLKFDKKGKKYASGQPEFGVVGKWVKVYDPRLDSTFPGGIGPCRAQQETTYVWSQNGPLHGLTWALGRWQNSKRVLGVGIEAQDIDIQAFVDAANVFDANGWAVGGVMDGSGDKWNTLRTILWAGAAEPLDLGGLLSCRYESPKVSLATITGDDLADGDIVVPAMKTWRNRINSIIPRYRSEAHNWEIIPASPVRGTTYIAEDGEERTRESEYYCCQSPTQAAQLAAYEIALSREIDGISIPLKTMFVGYKPGDCLTLNIPEANLNNQPVVVTNRTLDPATGIVTMTFRSETTAKHAWALGRTSSAPPSPSITSAEVMDALIWNNRASIPEERFNPLATYDFGRIVNTENGARYIYIGDTASAGFAPPNATYWSELSGSAVVDVAASIAGQGDLATRDAATLPFGSNSVVNSDFARGKFGWRAHSGTLDSQWGVNLPGSPNWYGQRNVMWINAPGALASGVERDVNPNALWQGGGVTNAPLFALPVVSGERVYARVLMARHRCNTQLYLLVFDAAGSLILAPSAAGGTDFGAADGNPDNFALLSLTATIPEDGRWAIPMMRMLGTGESDPYMFFAEPAIGKIAPGQTAIPAYSTGRADPVADQTAANTAAFVQGQTQWTTYTQFRPDQVVAPGFNLIADPGLRLGGKSWNLPGGWSVSSTPSADIGFFAHNSGNAANMRVGARVTIQAGQPYTFSIMNGGAGYLGTPNLQLNFYDGAGAFISQATGAGTAPNLGYRSVAVTAVAPGNAVSAECFLQSPGAFASGGFFIAYRPKLELGSSPTVWRDDATSGALYSTGADIDTLRPAEFGSNITETRAAAFVQGQTQWATSSIPTSRLALISDAGRSTSRRQSSQIVASGVLQTLDVNPITATTSGEVATITINAHSVFDDAGTLNFTGASIGGLAPGTLYYVYDYNPDFNGGARSYVATPNRNDITSFGRRFVGFITTPAAGDVGNQVEGGGGWGGGWGGIEAQIP